jgi:hypothetical protein
MGGEEMAPRRPGQSEEYLTRRQFMLRDWHSQEKSMLLCPKVKNELFIELLEARFLTYRLTGVVF